jgi:hypothetical protein
VRGLLNPLGAERHNVSGVGFDAFNRLPVVEDHESELNMDICRGSILGGAGAIRIHSVGFGVGLVNDRSVKVSRLTSCNIALSLRGETTNHSESCQSTDRAGGNKSVVALVDVVIARHGDLLCNPPLPAAA